ncbi:DUF465 domain-containing protein [Seongchinamella unica]|uniref:DUF465 domain-containing protein n=1 Tax=Seongchinamella unica TaxID=2547392 RepID=A0A4R5LWX5_9GAMM|nr:YdcH family protein [Seongchinamella unica]TDG15950.1 DUF465 domain-containing protein [Seongchinamella unica]
MLGENHSLYHDFPEMVEVTDRLIESDPDFAADAKRYHALDKEIRTLELRNSPIDDQAMQQLKLNRAEMKDSLYQRLLAAA